MQTSTSQLTRSQLHDHAVSDNQGEDPSPEDDERDERSLACEVIETAFKELRW